MLWILLIILVIFFFWLQSVSWGPMYKEGNSDEAVKNFEYILAVVFILIIIVGYIISG